MRCGVILLIMLSSSALFAKGSFPALTKKQIQSLSYNKLQMLRNSYLEFLKHEENKTQYKEKFSFIKYMSLINSAYADGGILCFFGGWPSVMEGGYCRSPWLKKDDPKIQAYGGYTPSHSCGSGDQFRCNPVLFGSPKAGQTNFGGHAVNMNPSNGIDKGYCVETSGTYVELTEKCEQASEESVDDIIDGYKENPDELLKFAKGIKEFCDKKKTYDACDNLKNRIEKISGEDFESFAAKSAGVSPAGANDASPGKAVLDKCEQIANESGKDVKDRNILSQVNDFEACPAPDVVVNDFEEIEKISEDVNRGKYLQKINLKAYRTSLVALMINKVKFESDDDAFEKAKASPEEFRRYMRAKYPNLIGYESEFNAVTDDVFAKVKKANEDLQVVRFEKDSAAGQFNELAGEVNKLCDAVHAEFETKFGKQNLVEKAYDNRDEEAYYNQTNPKIIVKLTNLINGSEVGNLMATPHFKDNVFDPTVNMAEECAYSKNYNVVKKSIDEEDINKANNEINSQLERKLTEIDDDQGIVKEGKSYRSQSAIRDYLMNDPFMVKEVMKDLSPEEQGEFAAFVCTESMDIYTVDKRRQVLDWVAMGVGTAAFVALGTAAGLVTFGASVPATLSLAGAILGTATVGVSAVELLGAGVKYSEAKDFEKASDLAMAEQRSKIEGYVSQQTRADKEKFWAGVQGGAAVVGIVAPMIKVVTVGKAGTSAMTKVDDVGDAVEIYSKTGRTTADVGDAVELYIKTGRTTADAGSDVAKPAQKLLDDAFKATDDFVDNAAKRFSKPPKGMSVDDFEKAISNIDNAKNEYRNGVSLLKKLKASGKADTPKYKTLSTVVRGKEKVVIQRVEDLVKQYAPRSKFKIPHQATINSIGRDVTRIKTILNNIKTINNQLLTASKGAVNKLGQQLKNLNTELNNFSTKYGHKNWNNDLLDSIVLFINL